MAGIPDHLLKGDVAIESCQAVVKGRSFFCCLLESAGDLFICGSLVFSISVLLVHIEAMETKCHTRSMRFIWALVRCRIKSHTSSLVF